MDLNYFWPCFVFSYILSVVHRDAIFPLFFFYKGNGNVFLKKSLYAIYIRILVIETFWSKATRFKENMFIFYAINTPYIQRIRQGIPKKVVNYLMGP